MKIHKLVHSKEAPFKCDICGKNFKYERTLKKHESTHSGVREKTHTCLICNKSFVCISGLKYHESVHAKEKPYSCKPCGKSFKRLSDLKDHEKNKYHLKRTSK